MPEPSMNTYICFAAIVAVKLRDDYGISVDTLPQPWFVSRIMHYVICGNDTSEAAFGIANDASKRAAWVRPMAAPLPRQ